MPPLLRRFRARILKLVNVADNEVQMPAAAGEANLFYNGAGLGCSYIDENTITRNLIDSSNNQAVAVGLTAVASPGTNIPPGTRVVKPVTTGATQQLNLPPPVVGNVITILPDDAGNGFTVTSDDGLVAHSINNTTGAGKVLTVAASTAVEFRCVSATAWIATKFSNVGAPAGAGTPA